VAAASIVAKVTRDRLMVELDRQFPGYGFAVHKGYPTAAHLAALDRYGPCLVHRRTFAGVWKQWALFPDRDMH
jgi:ribonuclease HII